MASNHGNPQQGGKKSQILLQQPLVCGEFAATCDLHAGNGLNEPMLESLESLTGSIPAESARNWSSFGAVRFDPLKGFLTEIEAFFDGEGEVLLCAERGCFPQEGALNSPAFLQSLEVSQAFTGSRVKSELFVLPASSLRGSRDFSNNCIN